VNENDVTLDLEVATGSEGEVWRGQLRGHGMHADGLAPLQTGNCLQVLLQSKWRQVLVRHGRKETLYGENKKSQVPVQAVLLLS
jgi:hypothetical protein